MLSYPCNAYHDSIYLLQSCVNVVFKLVCGPPSLSSFDQDSNPFSSHSHKHTSHSHSHTPIRLIFTRLIMPHVKYLRGCFWFVGDCFYSQLSPWGYIVHLNCFASMTKRSHEFVIKEEIKFVNSPKVREQAPIFSSNFAHVQRCTRKKKLIFRSSMKFPFQRIQDQ